MRERKEVYVKGKMKTLNKSFNESWEYLATFHPTAHFPNGESLDLRTKPKLSQNEWKFYIDALINVLEVGFQQRWIHVHVDGGGWRAYLFVPEEFATGKKISGYSGDHLSP